MINSDIQALAKQLWDYHVLNQTLTKSDCILALGTHDLRVAERAAELYLEGYAPLVVFSGGLGKITKDIWSESEAERFAAVAMKKGVPASAILTENKSTNTGENILFTQQLLKEQNKEVESFIVVQKPYMERRSLATFKVHWPQKKLSVTSPRIAFEDYATEEIPMETFINSMVGDLQRIKVYPAKGFQIYQEIPDDVWSAYEQLVAQGFDRFVIK
ncbi:MAG: YdcF family protein [Pseudobacter sp.]|uniref:YdcF family protein n=1 Tax=Pseudobacter sp. TaxID=2045420 RepID=UPI003F820EDF